MHVRPMVPEDTASLVDIASDAFIEDELFVFLYPKRHEYFQSWRKSCRIKLLRRILEPGVYTFLCVADEREADLCPAGQIMGYCCWQRFGDDSNKTTRAWKSNNRGLFCWLERRLLAIDDGYTELLRLDQSLSYPNRKAFVEAGGYMDTFAPLKNQWHLRSMAVSPRFQRRGVGQMLIAWGIEHARREDIAATVEASFEGSRLYRKMGFRTINWDAFAVEQNWIGGQTMIWDRHQDNWTEGQYTRLAVGDECKIEVGGKMKDIEVVWKSQAQAEVPVQDPQKAEMDKVSDKGP